MISSLNECLALGEKSWSAVNDYCVYILLAMLFYFRRPLPLGHRGHIQHPYVAQCGHCLSMTLHEVADRGVGLAWIPARGKQYGKSLVIHCISRLQSKWKRLHDFLVGSERKMRLICTRILDGGRSSVGRAPDCGSGCRGFDPHRSPFKKKVLKRTFFYFFNSGAIPFTKSSMTRALSAEVQPEYPVSSE